MCQLCKDKDAEVLYYGLLDKIKQTIADSYMKVKPSV